MIQFIKIIASSFLFISVAFAGLLGTVKKLDGKKRFLLEKESTLLYLKAIISKISMKFLPRKASLMIVSDYFDRFIIYLARVILSFIIV